MYYNNTFIDVFDYYCSKIQVTNDNVSIYSIKIGITKVTH